jgi:uncharacterized membrane protein YfcA
LLELLPDAGTLAVCLLVVFILAFMKGAFGGGLAALGIPLLSLALDPITAGALMAPLFIVMDIIAIRYWKPSTWSRTELAWLLPPMFAGTAIGFWLMSQLNPGWFAVAIALVTLGFSAQWFIGGSQVVVRPRSRARATLAGTVSGITSMMAHAGGPPVAIYMLSLGLSKTLYAGTMNMYFTAANAAKVGPWLFLASPDARLWMLVLLCSLATPPVIWLGWRLHQRLHQRQLYSLCYALLILASFKLLWDGLRQLGAV